MFEFLKVQYALGNITDKQLKGLIGIRITPEQYEKIVGGVTDG